MSDEKKAFLAEYTVRKVADDAWLAECPAMGLVATDPLPGAAIKKLTLLVEWQLEFELRNGKHPIGLVPIKPDPAPAPHESAREWRMARQTKGTYSGFYGEAFWSDQNVEAYTADLRAEVATANAEVEAAHQRQREFVMAIAAAEAEVARLHREITKGDYCRLCGNRKMENMGDREIGHRADCALTAPPSGQALPPEEK